MSAGIPRTWGVTSTGIPRTWGGFIGLEFRRHTGGFQESNFQFGVAKSLQQKLVKTKDDDSLVNTRHVQLNQHAGDTFQW